MWLSLQHLRCRVFVTVVKLCVLVHLHEHRGYRVQHIRYIYEQRTSDTLLTPLVVNTIDVTAALSRDRRFFFEYI